MSELEITIMTIPIGPFVVILSQIKELVIRILEMILRFYTNVIPSFKIDSLLFKPLREANVGVAQA